MIVFDQENSEDFIMNMPQNESIDIGVQRTPFQKITLDLENVKSNIMTLDKGKIITPKPFKRLPHFDLTKIIKRQTNRRFIETMHDSISPPKHINLEIPSQKPNESKSCCHSHESQEAALKFADKCLLEMWIDDYFSMHYPMICTVPRSDKIVHQLVH